MVGGLVSFLSVGEDEVAALVGESFLKISFLCNVGEYCFVLTMDTTEHGSLLSLSPGFSKWIILCDCLYKLAACSISCLF